MIKKWSIKHASVLISIILLTQVNTALAKASYSGFLDINFYPYLTDVVNDNVLTINVGIKLSDRLSYFSLNNFGNKNSSSELEALNTYYTEQNLRWKIAKDSPFDLTLQSNFRTGKNNDRHRLGMRWRLNNSPALTGFFERLHLKYSINLHAIQIDSDSARVWQMEHVFQLKLPSISKNLYLSGFIDHTINEDLPSSIPTNPIVAEVQLGYQVIEHFYLITEYRLNQYRRSDVNNIGIGMQYKISF